MGKLPLHQQGGNIMWSTFLITLYCILVVAGSLLGGCLPSLIRFTHTRMHKHGAYYTRYLAYALIAERTLGSRIPISIRSAIWERLWSVQDVDGGLWTNYNGDGTIPPFAKKTTEIGPLALLACQGPG